MTNFKEMNANPKNKKTTDCVIRALTIATGRDYWDVFEELCDLTKQTGLMFNEKRLEDKFLEANWFVKCKQPKKADGTKYTVRELDKICNDKIVIVRVAHHLTVVVNNTVCDTWDCRNKTINNYYIRSK